MAYLPDTLSLEERREFYTNYKRLAAVFGADLIDEGIMRLSVRSLIDECNIPLQDHNQRPIAEGRCYQKPNRLLGKKQTHHRFTNPGGWEKSVSVPVSCYMVPNYHQRNDEGPKIIAPALRTLHPWLHGFRLNVYKMDFSDRSWDEFYVELGTNYWKGGFGSLYVPAKAFLAGDVDAIVRRNQEYMTDYIRDPLVWARMKNDPVVIAFLDKVKEHAK